MKHLIDDREPITNAEIDQAQLDAEEYLAATPANAPGTARHIIARLLAIVDYSYGSAPEE